jgi:protein gp37
MNEQWAREIRDICATAGVALFMKQIANKAPIPDDLMVRQFPAKGLTDGELV